MPESAPEVSPPSAPVVHRRVLPLATVAGAVLFTLAWAVLGVLSPGYTLFDHRFEHYSPISQPISGLGIGATAAYMNSAFVISGLLLIIGVVSTVRAVDPATPRLRRWTATLLALTGAGMVVDGLFTLAHPVPHMLGFLAALGTPVISFPVAAAYFRHHPAFRSLGRWLRFGSPVTLLLLVSFFLAFQPTADGAEHGVAGLIQRVAAIEVLALFAAMGWLGAGGRGQR